ncbi:MAG: hypothetical protein AAEI92_00950 [Arenicellales bacterium]
MLKLIRPRYFRPMVGLGLLLTAVSVQALPECEIPEGLEAKDQIHYCMIHTFRTACLARKGYDMAKENWTVMQTDYDACTIDGCNQLLEQTGALSEALFLKACTIALLDRR